MKVFLNLPAINFNRILGCCTARTSRLFSASPSPLSPMSTSTRVCLARASFKQMSDFFLLPCAIAPPLPFVSSLASLTHTVPFTCGLRPPFPPPFLFCGVFTCNISLNVQCLSCSGVLRPSQWIGSSFGAEVTAPPSLSYHSPFLLLLSTPRAGGLRGKWTRRALHGE